VIGFITVVFIGILIASYAAQLPFSPKSLQTQQTDTTNREWPSYRNSSLGYQIDYPPDWKLSEGISMGYPYITLLDPVAQELPRGSTEVTKGAFIEISAEEYRAEVPFVDYIKNNVRPTYNENGELAEVVTEEKISNVWTNQGVYVIQRRGKVLQHNHAALVTYPDGPILLQIMLTIPDTTSDRADNYVDIFNQILKSLSFSKPVTKPKPIVTYSP